jgi:hypothetical protein
LKTWFAQVEKRFIPDSLWADLRMIYAAYGRKEHVFDVFLSLFFMQMGIPAFYLKNINRNDYRHSLINFSMSLLDIVATASTALVANYVPESNS